MLVVNCILLKLVLFMTLVKEQRKSTALFSHNTNLHHISTCLNVYFFAILEPLCDSIFQIVSGKFAITFCCFFVHFMFLCVFLLWVWNDFSEEFLY